MKEKKQTKSHKKRYTPRWLCGLQVLEKIILGVKQEYVCVWCVYVESFEVAQVVPGMPKS